MSDRDRDLDDALHSLAGDMQRTGRIVPAADIRRRGDVRRRVHTITAAAAGVVAVGAIAAGIAVAQPDGRPNGLPAGPSVAPTAARTSAPVPAASPSPPPTSAGARPSSTTPSSRPPATTTAPTTGGPAATDPVLSGRRQVAVVRVQAFESGVTLSDDGRLTEADDDSGSQLFVPVPLDNSSFLIRTADRREGGEAACWRAKNNGSAPLTVAGAPCNTSDTAQQFAITRSGNAWTIANRGAFLQYSSSSGLILEELGDAPLETTFRLVDNGAAPD